MKIKISIATILLLFIYHASRLWPATFINTLFNPFFKKMTVAVLIVISCLNTNAQDSEALYVDGDLPDLTIHNVINYTADSFKISDFKDRLLILNFWGTYCSACINRFEKEQELQQQFKNEVQFILVTDEPADKVNKTIARWEAQHHRKFIFPIVVADTVLNKYVRNRYRPHFAWVDYWQRLIAQTNEYYINTACITGMLVEMKRQKKIQDAIDAGAAQQTTLYKP